MRRASAWHLHRIEVRIWHREDLFGSAPLAVGLDPEAALRPQTVWQRKGAEGAQADVDGGRLPLQRLVPLLSHQPL